VKSPTANKPTPRSRLAAIRFMSRMLAYGCLGSVIPLTIVFALAGGWRLALLFGVALPMALSALMLAPVVLSGAGVVDAKAALDEHRKIRTRRRMPAAGQVSVSEGDGGGELSNVTEGALSNTDAERD
jgi:hypothetical protein